MSEHLNRFITTIEYQDQALDIHYRSYGNKLNPPIILLHPSPLSSAFMVPLLELFGQSHYVIAWDAPGYGDSSKLASADQTLRHYVECLALFMAKIDIDKAIIYGNATGAQIAIEFSKQYPEQTVQLLLENVACFDEQERQAMLAQYFPDLSPQADGQHIQQTWKMVNNLFKYFPWYDESQQAKLHIPLPSTEVLQATFIDYIKAGKQYADAYIAAMNNERPEQLTSITKPTQILIWQDSILYHYCQRLNNLALPTNITLHQVSSGMENRMTTLISQLSTG